jgi:hypothetical protein
MNQRTRTATGLGFGGWTALATAIALGAAAPAAALEINIGGIDTETQYNHPGAPYAPGILTFDDSFNGWNNPEPGVVTSADLLVAALLGADVNFEVLLDTSGFNPATGDVRDAVFIGTGLGPEITMMSGNTVLLAFDVQFIEVTQAIPNGTLGGPTGTIILGNPLVTEIGVTSELTVSGGSLNALVGGVGTKAAMELLLSSLNPTMTKTLRNAGYLNSNFTNGVGLPAVSATWNIRVNVPEPQTALLVAGGALALVAAARRLRQR